MLVILEGKKKHIMQISEVAVDLVILEASPG